MKDPALNPVHPGEVLEKDFLEPMGLSQYRLAKDIHVPPRRINEIVLGKRGITADTALRLARYFGTSAGVWLALQTRFELDAARLAAGHTIERSIYPAVTPTLAPAFVREPGTTYRGGTRGAAGKGKHPPRGKR